MRFYKAEFRIRFHRERSASGLQSWSMNTEKPPKKIAERDEYLRSDALKTIWLPPPEPFRSYAVRLKDALSRDEKKEVQNLCTLLIDELSVAYGVAKPTVKILSVRPREEGKDWVYETFGDYDPETLRIRLWMRTAVQKKPTSYGVLLSTLCHEFCHHLDMVQLEFPNTFHTRGFYDRVGLLYHHIQNTPIRQIVWQEHRDGSHSIDWGRTMKGTPRVMA